MPNLVKLHGSWEEKSDKHRSRVSKTLSFDVYTFAVTCNLISDASGHFVLVSVPSILYVQSMHSMTVLTDKKVVALRAL